MPRNISHIMLKFEVFYPSTSSPITLLVNDNCGLRVLHTQKKEHFEHPLITKKKRENSIALATNILQK